MNYISIHDLIIERALSEKRKKGDGIYYESHHIIPRSLGGSDDKSNKVLLTGREHFIIHRLLHKIYPDNLSLQAAYGAMRMLPKRSSKLIDARAFEEMRIASSIAASRKRQGKIHTLTCAWCAKEMEMKWKNREHKFCSKICSNKSRWYEQLKNKCGEYILKYDMNNNFIEEINILEILKLKRSSRTCILGCCENKNKTALGFIWKYKNKSIK